MWIPKTFLHAYKWLEIYVGMCRSCDALLSVCSCPRRRHQSLLAVFFFISFLSLWLHAGKRFELDRELNHISAPWMSWLCAETQTVGFQIRTQGLLFQSTFFFSHQHVSRSFLSFCFALILSLARGSSPSPPRRLSPVSPWRRGVTPGASSQEPVRRVVQTTGKISSTSSE